LDKHGKKISARCVYREAEIDVLCYGSFKILPVKILVGYYIM